MPKRAERRHHEGRVKDKFRRVVKEQTRWMANAGRWEFRRDENGRIVSRKHIIDRSKAVERLRLIDEQGAQMAHHPAHQCEMCHPGPKELKHQREFEVMKKAPMDDDTEE